MFRKLAALALLPLAMACTDATRDLADPVEPLGDFRLGFSEVVSTGPKPLLATQTIDDAVWQDELDKAIETRFNRFDGPRYYHLGVKVWEYSVPPPIIPGKSALHLLVTVWDDATQTKLTDEPESVVVIKVFESRISQTTEQRVTALAEEAAREIEKWLREQHEEEGWFTSETPEPETGGTPEPEAAEASGPATAEAG